jgi:prevent-host-death family protein
MILVMKRISIQDLKARLSSAIAETEAGATLLVTRHNEPVAQLSPVRPAHVHRGVNVGRGRLEPALKRGTSGRSLAVLLEDRGTR